jgi:hypothetical protein
MSAANPVTEQLHQAPGVRVVFCTWCKNVEIIQPGDAVIILFTEMKKAYVNGVAVGIGDGMCQGCRNGKFGDVPRKAVSNDLSEK